MVLALTNVVTIIMYASLLILAGYPLYISVIEKRNKALLTKSLEALSSADQVLDFTESIGDELSNYQNLPIIKKSWLSYFIITGTYKSQNFIFFQAYSKLQPYSVLILDTEKYDPEFDYIRITPKTAFTLGSGNTLEWITFNKKFMSTFSDPARALEVVTPTFMECLVELKSKYGFIDIQYFTDTAYQKESLVLIKKQYIYPTFRFRKRKIDDYNKQLVDYLESGYQLIKSI